MSSIVFSALITCSNFILIEINCFSVGGKGGLKILGARHQQQQQQQQQKQQLQQKQQKQQLQQQHLLHASHANAALFFLNLFCRPLHLKHVR